MTDTRFPLQNYYRIGLGVLKYKPDEFRAMSMGEFILAMDGLAMANGTYRKKATWNDVLEEEAKWQSLQSPSLSQNSQATQAD